MQPAKDPDVGDLARSQQRVRASADTDIGTPLAATAAALPSLVLFRRLTGRRHGDQAALLLANLAQLSETLHQGSVTVLEKTPVRIRRLPTAESADSPTLTGSPGNGPADVRVRCPMMGREDGSHDGYASTAQAGADHPQAA